MSGEGSPKRPFVDTDPEESGNPGDVLNAPEVRPQEEDLRKLQLDRIESGEMRRDSGWKFKKASSGANETSESSASSSHVQSLGANPVNVPNGNPVDTSNAPEVKEEGVCNEVEMDLVQNSEMRRISGWIYKPAKTSSRANQASESSASSSRVHSLGENEFQNRKADVSSSSSASQNKCDCTKGKMRVKPFR